MQGESIVKRGYWDIAAVDNLGPRRVWVQVGTWVEAAERRLTSGASTYGSRSKSGA